VRTRTSRHSSTTSVLADPPRQHSAWGRAPPIYLGMYSFPLQFPIMFLFIKKTQIYISCLFLVCF
jgi:hypothetical protein